MKREKSFDCVKMKDEIQAALLKEHEGMTDDQRHAAMERAIAVSDAPAARFWRQITARHPAAAVAETPEKYGR